MIHRGRDGEGIWSDGPVGLGHRRMAIIDFTSSGHQPMTKETGESLIVYNGELYNYRDLQNEIVEA